MRRLHQKVNLIPVIAKADTLTDDEITEFKQRVCSSNDVMKIASVVLHFFFHQVLSDIAHHNIQIFQAPMYENEDEETIAENEEIAVRDLNSIATAADSRFSNIRARFHLP